MVEQFEGVGPTLGDALGPVGLARRVGDVEDRLVGQLVDDRPGYGQPPKPLSKIPMDP